MEGHINESVERRNFRCRRQQPPRRTSETRLKVSWFNHQPIAPLRPLLSTKNDFLWLPDHDLAFSKAKELLTSPSILSFFDINKQTRLCTDASRQGLGFILQQKQGDTWELVQAGSRFLSDTESRYAVIVLELLAVTVRSKPHINTLRIA